MAAEAAAAHFRRVAPRSAAGTFTASRTALQATGTAACTTQRLRALARLTSWAAQQIGRKRKRRSGRRAGSGRRKEGTPVSLGGLPWIMTTNVVLWTEAAVPYPSRMTALSIEGHPNTTAGGVTMTAVASGMVEEATRAGMAAPVVSRPADAIHANGRQSIGSQRAANPPATNGHHGRVASVRPYGGVWPPDD